MTTSLDHPAEPLDGTTTTTTTTATAPGPASGARRLGLLSGAGFVAAVLAGNSLTESATGAGVLGDLDALAASTAARSGLVLELVAFVLLLCFIGLLAGSVRRTAAAGVLAVAGTAMVTVKLGSAAAYLAALHSRDDLDETTALALVEQNAAAFVLTWIPFGVFVAAAAVALAASGLAGRALGGVGLVLGVLGVLSGLVGAVWPAHAVPVPFLLSLLWVGVVSVRLALGRPRPRRRG